MRVLSQDDYSLFKQLVSLTQKELHRVMAAYLKAKYKQVKVTKDYIVAIGDIPIALTAHLDTVYKTPVQDLYYDQKKGVLWSPDGLGADDRAGIFAIIKILQSGLRPSVFLTTDEEQGGLGAACLSAKPCPVIDLKYIIELDRRGTNDCVFYDCCNPIFTKYIESFGFVERSGSFSDISFMCPEWQVCGVNLSVGYADEHSYTETLFVPALYDTINKVKKMLTVDTIPTFEYKELKYSHSNWFKHQPYAYDLVLDDDESYTNIVCHKCKQRFSDYEVIPAKGADNKTHYYCPDCVSGALDWCNVCYEPYEITPTSKKQLCNDCASKEGAKSRKK